MDRGGWTKPICALLTSGPTYTGQWTRRATRFFQKALRSLNHPRPRVVNVDGDPAYPRALDDFKRSREFGRRCRCRPVRYLNNIVEQDHRAIKRRVRAMQGFRSLHAARTIQGIETVHMIRKGQIRWLPKDDIPGQAAFITGLFGVTLHKAIHPSSPKATGTASFSTRRTSCQNGLPNLSLPAS